MDSRLSESRTGLAPADMADILRDGRRFEPALRGARILVTGATGWFGTWLLDALVALDEAMTLGLSIVALSRRPEVLLRAHVALSCAKQVTWVAADLRHGVPATIGSITHVIHAAAETGGRGPASRPLEVFETIVDGTRHVLRFAAMRPGMRLLLVSSGAVYGPQPRHVDRIVEDFVGGPNVLEPGNAYAEGKRAAEQLAAIWHATHGVEAVVARCFAFVGPHMPLGAHFAIGNFIRDAIAGGPIHVTGDGRARRSYLYTSDLVVWLLAILIEGRSLRPYNVGGVEAATIGSLARRCAAVSGDAVRIELSDGGAAGSDYVPDVARAMAELGVRVNVPLDAAIARTMAWATSRATMVDA